MSIHVYAAVIRRFVRGTHVVLALAALGACSDGSLTSEPSTDAASLFWALRVNHRAVTLALQPPFDTLTITAAPLNPVGAVLEGLGPVRYTSGDSTRVKVSREGVLQAVAVAQRIPVVAELQAGNVTHRDTVFVSVTATAPARPLAGLSIDPVPPNTAKLPHGTTAVIVPRVWDVDGTPFFGLQADFTTLDSDVLQIDRATGLVSTLNWHRPGKARIVASATAYGVSLADTTTYTIGLPNVFIMSVAPGREYGAVTPTTFTTTSVRVAAGASVVWVFGLDLPPTDVTFEDPTFVEADPVGWNGLGANTGAGNIPPPVGCVSSDPLALLLHCIKARKFPVPGTYRYRSTLTGAAGQIIVEAEDEES